MARLNLYLRTLRFIRPYTGLLGLSVVSSFLIVTFEGVSLWIIGTLANTLFNPRALAVTRPEITLGNLNEILKYWVFLVIDAGEPAKTLARVCLLFVGAFLAKNVFTYFQALVLSVLNLKVIRDLRNLLYGHALILPVTYYDRNKSGSILSTILYDVNAVNAAMSTTFTKLITEPVRLIVFVSLLFIISLKLTLAVFLIYPVLFFIIYKIGRSVRRRSRRVFENMSGLVSILHETVNGVRAVKMFNMNEAETRKFRNENRVFTRNSFRSSRAGALTAPLTEIFGLFLAVSLLWYGGHQVLRNQGLTAEDFVRYLTLLIFSYQPIKALGSVHNSLQNGMAAAERVYKVLDSPVEQLTPVREDAIPSFEKEIVFSDVSFTYPGCDEQVLRGVTFTVPKGSIVALVGPSGSGKSTILDLLPRFYDVSSGSIMLDGKDIRESDLSGLRHLFGIVAQETILFNDTVFNNIAYGSTIPPSPEHVVEAAKAANAWEFIQKLPQGLQSMIGEKGVLLSGGQCQRLSIARALLRNPPILILDEATSALDTESERLVQAAINRLMQNRTALVVAHRLSTVRNADQIIVIDKGSIIERGTHEQLLSTQSRYKYFYDMQFAAPAA